MIWIRIRIFGLIRIWIAARSVSTCRECIILLVLVILPRMVQIGWWWLMTIRNANECPKIRYSTTVKIMEKWHADPDHHQKLTSSRGSPLAHLCQVWLTSVSTFLRLVGEGNNKCWQTSPHTPLKGAATWQIKQYHQNSVADLSWKFRSDSWNQFPVLLQC